MGDLDRQIDGEIPRPRSPVEATIATTPATVDDQLFVTIDGNEGEGRYGPVLGWAARPIDGDLLLPTRGDNALVVKSDRGSWWMVGWDPA